MRRGGVWETEIEKNERLKGEGKEEKEERMRVIEEKRERHMR